MSVGPTEILLIGLVILLFFGGSRLGDVGKGLGDGIRNFKKGLAGDDDSGEKTSEKKAPKQLPAKADERPAESPSGKPESKSE
jgi:sec-independent protein translocase protein TatA